MNTERTVTSKTITAYINGKPIPAKLFTSYKGIVFLRKVNQWVEIKKKIEGVNDERH